MYQHVVILFVCIAAHISEERWLDISMYQCCCMCSNFCPSLYKSCRSTVGFRHSRHCGILCI